jgi:predicted alpha/beta-hydrolase family hydrolase
VTRTEHRFQASRSSGEVSAILDRPEHARWLYVFGHGAGAGMRHGFMERASAALGAQGIATFRYQFPYVEKGLRRPDPQPILLATVRAAVAEARGAVGHLPLLAGGKSMGGRMTSLASAAEPLDGVRGLVFFGFPLHPPGKPGTDRSEHLDQVPVPMLFLAGTRDKLANLDLMKPLAERLGERATLHIVEDADHSFAVPKRAGRDLDDVLFELARTTAEWAGRLEGS